MIKSYDLPNGRKITADFDENEIGKITVQALDSLICELNEYAERQKCENCKILELLVDMEIPTICEDDYNDCEYCEQNCNFKAPTKECYLHWAEQEPKVTTTSTDEPMVMQYPQVDGITPTVVKAEQEPCEDCDYSEIMDWEQDAKTGKAKPIYWCERHKEPCEDAVSRQAVLDVIYGQHIGGKEAVEHGLRNTYAGDLREIADEIIALPSVRPQEQIGKWEEIVKEHKCYARDDTYTTTEYHCSECGAEPFENEDGFYELSNYCPNCGAKMVEPTCDTCEYNTAAFMPCNACEDKSEYKPQESE